MTKEQFLSAINDIDDKFIKEITDAPAIPDNPQENYLTSEEPQVVYLSNEHIPFWKVALSTAAVICVLTVGLFTTVKLRMSQNYTPNNNVISGSSAEPSDTVSDSKPTTSEYLDLFERGGRGVPFEVSISKDDPSPVYTNAVTKRDDEQYATVQIDCNVVTSLAVYRDGMCIGRQIVDGVGIQTLHIDYISQAEVGENFVLCIWGDNSTLISGKWVP